MNALEILIEKKTWAVIGVTANKDKYGYKIYQKLKELNKEVYGISPKYKTIDTEPIYPDLLSLPKSIDVAVFVVNKKIVPLYLKQMDTNTIAWLQPGTYDESVLQAFNNNHIQTITDCVLIQSENI